MQQEFERRAGGSERSEALLPHLALAFKRTVRMVERESGMVGMRWFLLKSIWWREGLSQAEFCQKYEMLDASSVTRTAQALEVEGLLRRERDPNDNRVVRMYMTDAGRKVLGGIGDVNGSVMERMREVLGEDEISELRRMLTLVAEAMKDDNVKRIEA